MKCYLLSRPSPARRLTTPRTILLVHAQHPGGASLELKLTG
jgi:hypothetical protein